MANLFPINNGSSSNKVSIFKDGVFSIQPTKNTGVIQSNGALRLTGNQQLIIPYVSNDEIVFIRYKKVSNGGYFGLLTNSTRNSVTTTPEQDVFVGLYENVNPFVVIGLRGKTVINCTVTYGAATVPCTVDIIEIWIEKINN